MTLYLMLLMAGVETQTASLSSNEHTVLFSDAWYYDTLFYDGGAYLVMKGNQLDREGMTIHHWGPDGLAKIFTTTPREGLFNARAAAVSKDGKTLYFSDFLQGLIFEYEPGGSFNRYDAKLYTEALACYNGQLFRGNKSPLNNLESIKGDMPVLKRINKQLPDDKHASEEASNFNEMILLVVDHKLFVAYNLLDFYLVFDLRTGELLEKKGIHTPFAGYTIPDDTFVEITNDTKRNQLLKAEWYAQFHSLMVIAWHEGKLYGLFRKGYDCQGIWASLDGKSKSDFVWDNNQSDHKILAIGPTRVITADKEEKDDGETQWSLFLNSSLPSR